MNVSMTAGPPVYECVNDGRTPVYECVNDGKTPVYECVNDGRTPVYECVNDGRTPAYVDRTLLLIWLTFDRGHPVY